MKLLIHYTEMEVLICVFIYSSIYLEFLQYDKFILRWIHVFQGDSYVS